MVECPDCSGTGTVDCYNCSGEGFWYCDECSGSGERECDLGHFHSCDSCEGSGRRNCDECNDGKLDCIDCHGFGEVLDPDRETDEGL